MTRFAFAMLALTTPAFAHEGAHMHPHGAESSVSLMLAAVLVTGAAALAYIIGRRK